MGWVTEVNLAPGRCVDMKSLLLPFFDDDISQHAFDLSTRIVKPLNGYIEGFFALRRPLVITGDGPLLGEPYFSQFDEESRRLADRSRARFESCAAAQGLVLKGVSASDRPTAGWREIDDMAGQGVGSYGRLFDLIVVGRGFGHPWLDWQVMVESALFESGRPVLLTPANPGTTFGEHIVIAWNASTETARAVAFSMPLLSRARTVTIISIKGWGSWGPSGQELAIYLGHAGVHVTARTVEPNGRSPGVTILDECAGSGADLLLKGAYTQSRLRQLIFGGATRHILAEAQIPVLLAN